MRYLSIISSMTLFLIMYALCSCDKEDEIVSETLISACPRTRKSTFLIN